MMLDKVREGTYIVIHFPVSCETQITINDKKVKLRNSKFIVLRVVDILDRENSELYYGLIPVKGDTPQYVLTAKTSMLSNADGTLLPFAIAPYGESAQFPSNDIINNVFDDKNIWYIDPEDVNGRDMLYITEMMLYPSFIKVAVTIKDFPEPEKIQARFGKYTFIETNEPPVFGWSYVPYTFIVIPGVHYGFYFANMTNLIVPVQATFRYYYCYAPPVKDPETILAVVRHEVPNVIEWTFPAVTGVRHDTIVEILQKAYGFAGIPEDVYLLPRDIAVKVIEMALNGDIT